MSEQRWAVMRDEREAWIVSTPDHTDRDDDGRLICWDVDSIHDTWTEAMQEADRMARTITVTLPRVGTSHTIPADITPDPDIHITRESAPHGYEVACIQSGNSVLRLGGGEREALALALLAHARRKENRQHDC